jgi:hypothetical protein
LKENIAKIKDQMRGLGEIEQQLQASQERQISLTDPDARSMATSRLGSAVVGYNVQTAVDAKHHLIVAHEVTNSVTDNGQLAAMAKAAQEAAGHPEPIVLADRGYFEGYKILECERAGIATMVPKPLTSNSRFEGRFDKRDFIYDSRRDEYRCPAGQTAIYRFTAVEDGKTLHKYWSSACGGRHLKEPTRNLVLLHLGDRFQSQRFARAQLLEIESRANCLRQRNARSEQYVKPEPVSDARRLGTRAPIGGRVFERFHPRSGDHEERAHTRRLAPMPIATRIERICTGLI